MSTRETNEDGLSIRSYLRVVARWKWAVIGVTVLIGALGIAYTWTRTPMFSASSNVLWVQQIALSNPLSQPYFDTGAQQAEIESVPTIIDSAKVETNAEQEMSARSANADYSVSADLTPDTSGGYTNVVSIVGEATDPAVAADVANGYAKGLVAFERSDAQAQVAQAITVVQNRMKTYTTPAELQSDAYTSLQQQLQELDLLESTVTGNFQVITEASPPSAPFYPNKKKGAAEAIVIGLVLGIALAFLIEQFDTRLHGEDQVAELLDLPVIGFVPQLSRRNRDSGSLPTLSQPSGPAAESYRLLRGNLEFTTLDDDIKTLLITSSLQGEGKSVTACNLAVSMALAGKRVVLVDADLRSPRVHTYVGIPNTVGLSSVIARRVSVADAVVPIVLDTSPRNNGSLVMTSERTTGAQTVSAAMSSVRVRTGSAADPGLPPDWLWPEGPDATPILRVLTSGPLPPNPGEIVASRRCGEIIAELAADADIVLVDAPAMLPVGDTAALAGSVDALVYVVNTDKVRQPALKQAHSQLAHLSCRKLGIIEIADKKGHGYYGYHAHYHDGGRVKPLMGG
jgi:succinoglycan biosynthesis transport protein ExoP